MPVTVRSIARFSVPLCLAAGLLLLPGGCSSERKQAWLEFFFDGVPDSHAPPAAAKHPAAMTPAARVPSNQPPHVLPAPESVHPPYGRRECRKCHRSRYAQELRLPREELCLSCHRKFVDQWSYQHAPAVAGACLMCHHPHRTKLPHLLLITGAPVCLQCHDVRDLSRIPAHANPSGLTCYACHDPHGGGNPCFLKPSAPKTRGRSSSAVTKEEK